MIKELERRIKKVSCEYVLSASNHSCLLAISTAVLAIEKLKESLEKACPVDFVHL